MIADLKSAIRSVIGGRLFTLAAVFCLTLGIATNTTMFSVFDGMFLRPLPFKDAARLVSVAGRHPETGRRVNLTLNDARDLGPAVSSLDALAAYSGRTVTLTEGGEPERLPIQLVSANLFSMLGVAPQRGHLFEPADDRASAAGAALISDSLWRRRYQASESALGKVIRLDNAPTRSPASCRRSSGFRASARSEVPITPALGSAGASSRNNVAGWPRVTKPPRSNARMPSCRDACFQAERSRPPRIAAAVPCGRGAGYRQRRTHHHGRTDGRDDGAPDRGVRQRRQSVAGAGRHAAA